MTSLTAKIFKDEELTKPYGDLFEIQIKGKKARVINPFGGVFGMSKWSGFNNLNTIRSGISLNMENYKVCSLIVEGKKIFMKLFLLP